jgi:hypothetical protein
MDSESMDACSTEGGLSVSLVKLFLFDYQMASTSKSIYQSTSQAVPDLVLGEWG